MRVKTTEMKYTSQAKQLTIGEFRSSLEGLDKSNRWVMLGDLMPWAKIEKLYNSRLHNQDCGAGNKPARMIIGAVIIKHKLALSDEETIQMIRENPYMQYFVGLSEFTDKPIFDPSLFVTIRKRIGVEDFNSMSVSLLEKQVKQMEEAEKRDGKEDKGEEPNGDSPDAEEGTRKEVKREDLGKEFTDEQGRLHKGVLKIDATCSDAEVRYPTDVDLVHDGCKVINRYMDKICETFGLPRPVSHYKSARYEYLRLIKRKARKGNQVKSTMRILLHYLHADIQGFMDLVAPSMRFYDALYSYEKRTVTAIIKMYHQQLQMLTDNVHQCADRIISIFQPHLRPIVRGKAKARAEFGAKTGAGIYEGYTFIDHLNWNAYNEESDAELQIELFKERFSFLPAAILADKIYMNKANRKLFKDYGIHAYCRPLGRPPKEPKSPEYLARMSQAVGDRNEVEASFGTGKRVYRANNIRAKLPDTAASWIGSCYFVKNLMKFLRELCHVLTEICRLLDWRIISRRIIYNPLSLAA